MLSSLNKDIIIIIIITCIQFWTSSDFGQIRTLIAELVAL